MSKTTDNMEVCWKCGGNGRLAHYAHVDAGICYACKGVGFRNEGTAKPARRKASKGKVERAPFVTKGCDRVESIVKALALHKKPARQAAQDPRVQEFLNETAVSLQDEEGDAGWARWEIRSGYNAEQVRFTAGASRAQLMACRADQIGRVFDLARLLHLAELISPERLCEVERVLDIKQRNRNAA